MKNKKIESLVLFVGIFGLIVIWGKFVEEQESIFLKLAIVAFYFWFVGLVLDRSTNNDINHD